MAEHQKDNDERLSKWWRIAPILIMGVEFAVLISIAVHTYTADIGAPIPVRVTDANGATVFTGEDITEGQHVFLKYGLMNNGTIWGHGAYIGPDFSASYLHQLALDVRAQVAQEVFQRPYTDLSDTQRRLIATRVGSLLAQNRYDRDSGILVFTPAEAASFRLQISRWGKYFRENAENHGLDGAPLEKGDSLQKLTAFFAWTAWASTAHVPGREYSYTNNFPHDPAVGNGPTDAAILWSGLSLIALLATTGAVLLAFGRFHYLGWKPAANREHEGLLPGPPTPGQQASMKLFLVAVVLFLIQVLVGGATAHFRVQPGSFYGFDLARFFPSNLTRTWHLQLGVLWIATAYIGGGLFMASALAGSEPANQKRWINILSVPLLIVVFGSLVGEYLSIKGITQRLWFWFGNQGWEYLEIGRAWQILLVVGFMIWAVLLLRTTAPAWKDPQRREISVLFLLAAFAIPFFYLPALFYTGSTRFTIVDTWRFWIIHLWVEGFFELFATVMVAVMFFRLGMVRRVTALRVIYLDAILFLGAGILGTGHHWYWTGQPGFSMALSAVFSAMEVVPLILLTLDAWDFVTVTRAGIPHKWAFYFLIAVGVWNFVGAGIFGFLINLPVVSYYEAGTNLTANHGHGALMGVFGMLALAMTVFALRQTSSKTTWRRVEKYVRVSFWGLNVGLALMLFVNLFPTGVLQLLDVVRNGYWHARTTFLQGPTTVALEWARLPADLVFIALGVVPMVLAVLITYLHRRELTDNVLLQEANG